MTGRQLRLNRFLRLINLAFKELFFLFLAHSWVPTPPTPPRDRQASLMPLLLYLGRKEQKKAWGGYISIGGICRCGGLCPLQEMKHLSPVGNEASPAAEILLGFDYEHGLARVPG